MSGETLTERLAEAVEAWSWHEATDDTIAGYGFHMSQMLARLPIDRQTSDMQASINSMIADLTTLTAELAAAQAERDAARAQVAAVEAHCAEMDARTGAWLKSIQLPGGDFGGSLTTIDAVRAALDQPGQTVARIKADAWDEAVGAVASGIGGAIDANRRHGFGQAIAALAGVSDAVSRMKNPHRADAIESEAGQ